ncbi:MAG: pyridoxamine 5'-phosphate oxidase family protein [Dysgonamonadaceae bacterium]|jgi:nitroimidazol reductase NimA-like FMN-containing flavoprotein (pyridoxamine 5'-phosphate oxidase superfamily)|nr:pyridoxamine 5'-phosphate oxidase family protein [Dysgonamonadaceae bacterium]
MKTIYIENREEIEKVIAGCDVCYVGFVDGDEPYVIPMNFGYKDQVIYLHSAPEGRSIRLLEKNNRVCITFSSGHQLAFQHPQVACSYRMKARSVIAYGTVRFVDDFEKKVDALNMIMSHYSDEEFKYSDPAVINVKIWTIKIDRMSCKEFGAPHK